MSKGNALPDITPLNLGKFFQDTFVVPSYQRNYSWTSQEVETLLTDLLTFFDTPREPFYLLGDVIIVASKNKDFDFEIIDGQQRITTLVILFTALIRKLRQFDLDPEEIGELKTLVYKARHLKVKMSGKASESVTRYLEGEDIDALPKDTPSQLSVIEAIETIEAGLTSKFGENAKSKPYKAFFDRLQKNVYLSQLKLGSAESAFEFFERVNDRGRPLSKTDLLKNRLLAKISDAEYERASETWAEAEKRLLRHGREGSMSFLMRQMRIADEGVKVKENDLFRKWKASITDDEAALRVFDRINRASVTLDYVLDSKTPFGEDDLDAVPTRFMKFTQNVGVKLAAANLSPAAFDALSKRLSARAMLSLFSLERSQTYESLVAKWANTIHGLDSSATENDIVTCIDIPQADIDTLLARALPVIDSLRYGSKPGHTSRIRLLLALVNFELLKLYPVQHYGLNELLTTSKKTRGVTHDGYDIEHIGAKSTSANLGDLVNSIGNLTLMYSKDNRSAGNADVKYKAETYANSICYGTKLLTTQVTDPSLEAKIGNFRTSTVDEGTWTLNEVHARQAFYWEIFESIIRRDLPASDV
jgi:hypothetical protein